jgi:hypothetical protein
MVWALIAAAVLVGVTIAAHGQASGWLHSAMLSLHGHK